MLIRFTVENFSSFKEEQKFSLIPGKGRLKSEHKTKAIKGISTLKTSVIFGANASGKSNLIKAISFGKKLLLKGVKAGNKINFQNFRLNSDFRNKTSKIEYEIQHKGKNYAYGFVFDSNEIKEEWLFEITSKKDICIFERTCSEEQVFKLDFLLKKQNKEQQQFLKFIAKGTPDNNLFLNEIKTRKVKENVTDIEDLWNVIDWFQNSLKVIFPDDKYKEGLKFELQEDEELLAVYESFLKYFDTGICGISLEPISEKNILLPRSLLEKIKEDLLNRNSENIRATVLSVNNTTYFFSNKNNEIIYHKFMTKHKTNKAESDELFDTSDESDGTNRIIDFIPLLMDLLKGDNVFIIDEMERSLHPNLIYDLIDLFLAKSKGINSQLILASHESSLLTQKLLRKDEVWFTVKNKKGATQLHSLEEYSIRFDKKIRKDYLLGRFKAIPKLGNRGELAIPPTKTNHHA